MVVVAIVHRGKILGAPISPDISGGNFTYGLQLEPGQGVWKVVVCNKKSYKIQT
jgi:hypothetical protein